MKKLKLFSAIFLLVALISGAVFSLLYFTKKDVNAKVVTTIFPLYDICREIMGSDDWVSKYAEISNQLSTMPLNELATNIQDYS